MSVKKYERFEIKLYKLCDRTDCTFAHECVPSESELATSDAMHTHDTVLQLI